jgi:hypothetical protein
VCSNANLFQTGQPLSTNKYLFEISYTPEEEVLRALWFLGYPKAALEDAGTALKNAREIGQAATLMYALSNATWSQIHCGNYAAAAAQAQELLALAQEKGAAYWTAFGMINQGCV